MMSRATTSSWMPSCGKLSVWNRSIRRSRLAAKTAAIESTRAVETTFLSRTTEVSMSFDWDPLQTANPASAASSHHPTTMNRSRGSLRPRTPGLSWSELVRVGTGPKATRRAVKTGMEIARNAVLQSKIRNERVTPQMVPSDSGLGPYPFNQPTLLMLASSPLGGRPTFLSLPGVAYKSAISPCIGVSSTSTINWPPA